jgi:hypothetical protein
MRVIGIPVDPVLSGEEPESEQFRVGVMHGMTEHLSDVPMHLIVFIN